MTEEYEAWIAGRSDVRTFVGIDHGPIGDHLFGHQRDLVAWALRRGRAAIFADTGLGKTAMQVEWARHIVASGGRVLILAPLAVAEQTVREAARFGVAAAYRRRDEGDAVTVANYEMLEHFDPSAFAGVVLDESSILKSYTGSTRTAIIEAFRDTPYRLACTATPAPNDFTELGNHAEFLGVKSRVEMLAEYFVHDGGSTQDWRVKGHAVVPFWRWVASWGAVIRMPSDLGYSDDGFTLPPLRMHEHVVRMGHEDAHAAGLLFAAQAVSLQDQRAVRRGTTDTRAQIVAEVAGAHDGSVIVWCELNAEADAVTAAIPGAVQVAGADSIERKVDVLTRFAAGDVRVLVTKPSIAGFGMNWQHCHKMIFAGVSHSYEQTYQAIRRCWRFGQRSPVDVHMVRADTEQAVVENYRRKEADAARMSAEMSAHVREVVVANVRGGGREWNPYNPSKPAEIPSWLRSE
jgi:superfamily II DNA or RNA helicase